MIDKIIEATVTDLKRKQKSITKLFPTFDDRVKAIQSNGGIKLTSVEQNLWQFNVASGTKKGVEYDVYLEFKNIIPTLQKIVKDRRLWVSDKSRIDRKKLARKLLDIVDVKLKCSCPADLWWGTQYVRSLGKYDAQQDGQVKLSPKVRNPKAYGAYCKHSANLMRALPFYVDTMMKWLKDFYEKDIAKFEQEAQKEFGTFKQAAKELGKKADTTEQENKPEVTKESKLHEQANYSGSVKEADVPEYLFHATYLPLKKKIEKEGLVLGKNKNWEFSDLGVYFDRTYEGAEAFAEESDIVPEDWIDNIIVFKVFTKDLILDKLEYDPNVIIEDGEQPYSFIYKGNVQPSHLHIVEE
jgi:hypothetical protein